MKNDKWYSIPVILVLTLVFWPFALIYVVVKGFEKVKK